MNDRKLVYKEKVEVTESLDSELKKCFKNHLTLYNYALDLLKKENLEFSELKERIIEHIKEINLAPVIYSSFNTELFYLCKKAKKNIFNEKMLTGIQYMTFILSKDVFYKNIGVLDIRRFSIKLKHFDGLIKLKKEVVINEDDFEKIYFNLSLSSKEDSYMLTIFVK